MMQSRSRAHEKRVRHGNDPALPFALGFLGLCLLAFDRLLTGFSVSRFVARSRLMKLCGVVTVHDAAACSLRLTRGSFGPVKLGRAALESRNDPTHRFVKDKPDHRLQNLAAEFKINLKMHATPPRGQRVDLPKALQVSERSIEIFSLDPMFARDQPNTASETFAKDFEADDKVSRDFFGAWAAVRKRAPPADACCRRPRQKLGIAFNISHQIPNLLCGIWKEAIFGVTRHRRQAVVAWCQCPRKPFVKPPGQAYGSPFLLRHKGRCKSRGEMTPHAKS